MRIRQPIVSVLGHVDSGKTSLLDKVRGTGVQGREAGGITQHIGASFLPVETIQKICGPLYEKLSKVEHKIPGILVIDTPGHEIFTNLRSRGGSAADTQFISQTIEQQNPEVQAYLDEKIYNVVTALSVLGYQSEAFYRITDYKKEIAIVPVSAKTGIGIPELFAVLVGLTQQYLKDKLKQDEKSNRGIILEVNDEVGLGPTANLILIDGQINKGDSIIVAKRDSVIVTKPKALLLPKALDEMRDPRDKFKPVEHIQSAAGVKIASPDLEGVLPGSTLYATDDNSEIESFKNSIEDEMQAVFINTETKGVVLKCDAIGSLEALIEMLRRQQIPISKADIGPVTRRDVLEAMAVKESDRHLGVVLAFNVKSLQDAETEANDNHIKIFTDKIIYSLIDTYSQWVDDDKADKENAIFKELTPISKFTFLKGFVFRNNNPAVFGIKVDIGNLRQKIPFMNKTGKKIGIIHQLQHDGKTVDAVKIGQEVACSVQNVTIGRQIVEDDVFYTLPSSSDTKKLLKQFMHKLSSEERNTLNEIVEIQRKIDPAYGY